MATAIILLIMMVIVIFAVKSSLLHFKGRGGCCGGNSTGTTQTKELKNKVIGSVEISVSGMHCDNCAEKLIDCLQSIEGISAKVDLAKSNAIISYDQPIDMQQVYSIIENSGYKIVFVHQSHYE